MINPRLVRSYDLRGRVGSDLTEADARALGLAYADLLAGQGGSRVAVGYDGRLSSPMLEQALVAGLVAGGAIVERIGRGPTPMLYFAVHERGLDGGVMVTGSHNPPDQNGFKLLIGTEPIWGDPLAALARRSGTERPGGSAAPAEVAERYLARLVSAAEGAPPLRIGWDAGNGAAGEIVSRLTERLPGEHHLINCTIDGVFPAHHPDPSVPETMVQLQALVRERGLDLGIAFDGDGDRIGAVDGEGEIVWPDQITLLLARDLLARVPGATIVADVKSSRTLFDGIAEAGGRAVLAPAGYVRLREVMLREAAPLAGEMSGHIFFADRWIGTDDGLHVAMRLLGAIGRSGQSLAAFRHALPPSCATPELRLACPDERKAEVLTAVAARVAAEGAEVDHTDGLRVTTAEGWWLLRSSGTEPKLTARVEAGNAAALERMKRDLFARLEKAGLFQASSVDPNGPEVVVNERTHPRSA